MRPRLSKTTSYNLLHVSETICQTVDNYDCQFPFTYQGKEHYYCTSAHNDEIDSGRWCSIIDNESKSVGGCKSSCPKRKFKLNSSCINSICTI